MSGRTAVRRAVAPAAAAAAERRPVRAVITGGARGIGYALAGALLERGASVAISGRDRRALDAAVDRLGLRARPGAAAAPGSAAPAVIGVVCDVADAAQVDGLWDAAAAAFGGVDLWINNAGLGQGQSDLVGLDSARIGAIFATNCAGALYGCRTALRGFLAQQRGAVYNIEGLGSRGERVAGMTAYAASKRALAYITDALAAEVRGAGVIVGALQPGMTATDLITAEYAGKAEAWAKVRPIFDIISDKPETIAPYLVDRMLANSKNGARIVWLPGWKIAGRFLAAPFVKRRVYPETL